MVRESLPCPAKMWYLVIFGEVVMYGAFPLLVDMTKTGSQISFLSSSFTFNTEAVKLLICLVILTLTVKRESIPIPMLTTVLLYSVPAFFYCINNNLSVFMQTQMDPATYMVLGNLKIISTALIYKMVYKKGINNMQMFAMILLTCGAILHSVNALTSEVATSLSEVHITWLGLISILSYCLISGFSGVFTEYIFKRNDQLPVYFQNAILYSFGMLFSFLAWLLQAKNHVVLTGDSAAYNLFYGYSMYTWALIVTQAPLGIILSLIMKYNSNIVRLFIIATAPLVTTLLSHFIFGLQIHGGFVVSTLLILTAAVTFHDYASKDVGENGRVVSC